MPYSMDVQTPGQHSECYCLPGICPCECMTCNPQTDPGPLQNQPIRPIFAKITKDDPVKHPSHYTRGKIEVWDFIVDQGLNYCTGTAVRYLCRAGYKDPNKHVEDLNKAKAFIEREIKRLETGA